MHGLRRLKGGRRRGVHGAKLMEAASRRRRFRGGDKEETGRFVVRLRKRAIWRGGASVSGRRRSTQSAVDPETGQPVSGGRRNTTRSSRAILPGLEPIVTEEDEEEEAASARYAPTMMDTRHGERRPPASGGRRGRFAGRSCRRCWSARRRTRGVRRSSGNFSTLQCEPVVEDADGAARAAD